jgi:zinc transporter ZupT
MEIARTAPAQTWLDALREHARAHSLAALGLGLAAGAMIFVVSHEVIPETHRNGHQTPATLGLMAGFALMMVLDTALG